MDFYDVAINYPLFMLEAFTLCVPILLVCAIIFYTWGWKDGKRFKTKEDNWRKEKGKLMIHCDVEEFDIRKLEQARDLVEQVAGYYYLGINSRDLFDRLHTITNKLTSVIYEARDYQKKHDRLGKEKKDAEN